MKNRYGFTSAMILLVLAASVSCHGEVYYWDMVNLQAVSASALGRGGDISGGAYIWSQNALDFWDNPAKLGYARGLSYGHLVHDYDDSRNRRAACMTLGWKGIGILLPAYNDYRKFGHSLDHDDHYYKEDVYERTERYGLGVNLLEALFNRFLPQNPLISEVSVGVAYQRYIYDWGEFTHSTEQSTINLGAMIRMAPIQWGDFSCEMVTGFTWTNIDEKTISYYNLYYSDNEFESPLVYGLKYSMATKGSYCPNDLLDRMNRDFFNEIVSVAFTMDDYDIGYKEDEEDRLSMGIELSLLECLYFRTGTMKVVYEVYDDSDWSDYGYGLRLHYRDAVEFQWNWAQTQTDFEDYEMYDFMLRINLFELGNLRD